MAKDLATPATEPRKHRRRGRDDRGESVCLHTCYNCGHGWWHYLVAACSYDHDVCPLCAEINDRAAYAPPELIAQVADIIRNAARLPSMSSWPDQEPYRDYAKTVIARIFRAQALRAAGHEDLARRALVEAAATLAGDVDGAEG